MTDGSGWASIARRLTRELETRFDAAKARLGETIRGERSVVIEAYRGYGTEQALRVRGRVLRDPGVRPAQPGDRWWMNLLHAYKRLESDEVPFAKVEVSHGDAQLAFAANEEGHFDGHLPIGAPPSERPWTSVDMRLLDETHPPVQTRAPVFVPLESATLGVISDMDDTVIRTDARSLWRMVRLTLFANAHTRVAFPGVAAFFRALHEGETGSPHNPLFYVSSSPWNLHDLLEHFLELNGIPEGPLVLRDWGANETELLSMSHRDHKLTAIREILDTYPALPFILIGDSGQKDPEIYREVVHEYPGRIHAAYIRDVTPDPLRKQAIQELADEVSKAGSSLVLAPDTLAAARHAVRHGWVTPDVLERIEAQAGRDRAEARADGETPETGRAVVIDGG